MSPLTFNCVLLLLLLLLIRSLEEKFEVEVGKNAYLPCSYILPSSRTPVPVCWGKGPCPWSQCANWVLRTDERKVTHQKSSRYQLKGNFYKGDVSLTIENVTVDDHGTYCCRVQFPGPGNDQKLNLELVITPAKFTLPTTAHGDPATTSPRTLTTKRDGFRWRHEHRETQTLGTLHDGTPTQISTWSDEMKDSRETIRTAVYIGVGVSAGLALALIFGVLILKWNSYKKKKLQTSSLITLANLPPVGIANEGAGRNRSEENVYTIEENIYETENSNEYYCYVSGGQPSVSGGQPS
ncbi:hepatitis A virus cellular receptor 2 [Onychomys torridus]|uniref:hepatitis A virus cellular receptor 2 n=1 Tax=Onychomys torridus TaxID=38674 RepID=UPI00167F9F2D|nr:hepatitis A virus cellular receptor 2 [Onychomys torridus]